MKDAEFAALLEKLKKSVRERTAKKYITRLAGFELLNRIEIKDRKTGRKYK